MNMDFGILGKVVLQNMDCLFETDRFVVHMDGYTDSGIRVHGVVPKDDFKDDTYSDTWRNAILVNLEDFK